MKKVLILLSTISVSAMLSACGHNDTDHDTMHRPPMDHSQESSEQHREHMRMAAEYYFNQMDTNHDGEVTLKEYMAYQRMKFREADTSHQGYLTVDDIIAAGKRERQKMWEWKREHHGEMPHDGGDSSGQDDTDRAGRYDDNGRADRP